MKRAMMTLVTTLLLSSSKAFACDPIIGTGCEKPASESKDVINDQIGECDPMTGIGCVKPTTEQLPLWHRA